MLRRSGLLFRPGKDSLRQALGGAPGNQFSAQTSPTFESRGCRRAALSHCAAVILGQTLWNKLPGQWTSAEFLSQASGQSISGEKNSPGRPCSRHKQGNETRSKQRRRLKFPAKEHSVRSLRFGGKAQSTPAESRETLAISPETKVKARSKNSPVVFLLFRFCNRRDRRARNQEQPPKGGGLQEFRRAGFVFHPSSFPPVVEGRRKIPRERRPLIPGPREPERY